MFAHRTVLIVSAIFALPASTLKVAGPDDCPFGYGVGCNGVDPSPASTDPVAAEGPHEDKIDSATKAKIADILGGILTKLANHKDLVQVKHKLAKAIVSESEVHQTKTMSTEVAKALKGLLDKMQGGEQATARDALATMLAAESPEDVGCTYFGACGDSRD